MMLKPSVIVYQKEVSQFKPWPKGNQENKSVRQNKATRQSVKHQPEPAESRVEPKKFFSKEVEEQQNIEQIGQDDDVPDGLDVNDDDDDYTGEDDLSLMKMMKIMFIQNQVKVVMKMFKHC